MISRDEHLRRVSALLRKFRLVVLLGARQVGKTTLAGELIRASSRATTFDLELPEDLGLLDDPILARPLR